MKRLLGRIALLSVLSLGGLGFVTTMQPAAETAAIAAESTVTLAVDYLKGGCPSCVFIVRGALSEVDGVAAVDVSAETGTAIVTFDDAKTDITALTAATTNAGYPSRPLGEGQ